MKIPAAVLGLAALAISGPGFRCYCSTKPGRIEDAHLAAKVDWKRHAVEGRAREFSPLVRRFVLVARYRDLAPDSELRLRWRYLGGKEPKLFRRDLRVLEGSGRVLCGARKDKGVWPPGPYDVMLELDGKPVGRVRFSVSSKTSYRFVVDGSDGPVGSVGADEFGKSDQPEKTTARPRPRPRIRIPGGNRRLWLNLEALNPKPGSSCRVTWRRKGPEGDWSFYEESELVPIRETGLVAFELPRPRNGYCAGAYRAEARVQDKVVAKLDFDLVAASPARHRTGRPSGARVRKGVGSRSRGARARTGKDLGRPGPRAAHP